MHSKQYDFGKLRVLVIDDCKFMRKVIVRMLEVFGISHIETAKDGYEGLTESQNFKPDIVICDWEMAPMDGPEFVSKFRTSPDTPDPFVPIIMLTGYTEKYRVLAARDFGVTEFVAKPVSGRVLYARLVSVVEHPRPYVRTKQFFGPDRRRTMGDLEGSERRHKERAANSKR